MNHPTPIKIRVDGHEVELAPGQSVLDGARKLGIDIPTLCYLEKCGPLTSCLVCLVKINGRLVPSCGTKATPGMVVASETDEIHEARRTAPQLLFSDHVGECLGPLNRLCPLGLDIPLMLRQIQAGRLEEAAVTICDALPMPAVLGRLCHHPCEQGCRRGTSDVSASIRELERYVADWSYGLKPDANDGELSNWTRQIESVDRGKVRADRQSSGKSVVIIGTGPTGLAAAYQLLRDGHACMLVDRHDTAGGTLRSQLTERDLPRAILDTELAALVRLGAEFKLGVAFGTDLTLDGLLRGFDAGLLAPGEISKSEGEALGLPMAPGGVKVNAATGQTEQTSVFAAGRAVKPVNHVVKAMAEGVAVAGRIHQFLAGNPISGPSRAFSSIMGRLEPEELNVFLQHSETAGRINPCDACAGCLGV